MRSKVCRLQIRILVNMTQHLNIIQPNNFQPSSLDGVLTYSGRFESIIKIKAYSRDSCSSYFRSITEKEP